MTIRPCQSRAVNSRTCVRQGTQDAAVIAPHFAIGPTPTSGAINRAQCSLFAREHDEQPLTATTNHPLHFTSVCNVISNVASGGGDDNDDDDVCAHTHTHHNYYLPSDPSIKA
ncbi:hypothetical protein RUM44_002398 [Polyplax serrata]|uniref:Uncharacterized protein n=1 Tax=Polyplax serrata TaxID=468196 RepID=A0ABR1AF42_POLSC